MGFGLRWYNTVSTSADGNLNLSDVSKPPRIVGPLSIYGILAMSGIIGPVVFIAANAIAAFSVKGYDPLRNSISSLAWTPMGWLQSIGFLTIGLLVELFAAGLFFSIRGGRGFGIGIGLLVCVGFGLLLIGAFREDLDGASRTIQGAIHTATAAAVFSIFPLASLLIALSIRKDSNWRGLFNYTIIATCLAVGFVVGYLWLMPQLHWVGLYERILVANTVVWIEIMAIRLLVLSLSFKARLERPHIF